MGDEEPGSLSLDISWIWHQNDLLLRVQCSGNVLIVRPIIVGIETIAALCSLESNRSDIEGLPSGGNLINIRLGRQ
jgi:hypothetical protein